MAYAAYKAFCKRIHIRSVWYDSDIFNIILTVINVNILTRTIMDQINRLILNAVCKLNQLLSDKFLSEIFCNIICYDLPGFKVNNEKNIIPDSKNRVQGENVCSIQTFQMVLDNSIPNFSNSPKILP